MATAAVSAAPASPHGGPPLPSHAVSNGHGDVPEVMNSFTLQPTAMSRTESVFIHHAGGWAAFRACTDDETVPAHQDQICSTSLAKPIPNPNAVKSAQVGPLAEAGVEVFHAAANGLPSWFRC